MRFINQVITQSWMKQQQFGMDSGPRQAETQSLRHPMPVEAREIPITPTRHSIGYHEVSRWECGN